MSISFLFLYLIIKFLSFTWMHCHPDWNCVFCLLLQLGVPRDWILARIKRQDASLKVWILSVSLFHCVGDILIWNHSPPASMSERNKLQYCKSPYNLRSLNYASFACWLNNTGIMISDAENIFMYLLTIWIFFFRKMFRILPIFLIIFCYMSSVYILVISPLSDVWFAQIFSPIL